MSIETSRGESKDTLTMETGINNTEGVVMHNSPDGKTFRLASSKVPEIKTALEAALEKNTKFTKMTDVTSGETKFIFSGEGHAKTAVEEIAAQDPEVQRLKREAQQRHEAAIAEQNKEASAAFDRRMEQAAKDKAGIAAAKEALNQELGQ